jgi:hypothetical protein
VFLAASFLGCLEEPSVDVTVVEVVGLALAEQPRAEHLAVAEPVAQAE